MTPVRVAILTHRINTLLCQISLEVQEKKTKKNKKQQSNKYQIKYLKEGKMENEKVPFKKDHIFLSA